MQKENPTTERLGTQIEWYDHKSNVNRRWFQWLKILEIVVAALIPFLSTASVWPTLVGYAGLLIVVLEGLQHLFQFQNNWTSYRSTCESLKHEKYLWLAKSGPYFGLEDGDVILLADRIESLISQEHAKWVAEREKGSKK